MSDPDSDEPPPSKPLTASLTVPAKEQKEMREIKEEKDQAREQPPPNARTILESTVVALVSSAKELEENMLIRFANIGNIVINAAMDTCATNCFVSRKTSEQLRRNGYAPFEGPIRYDVRQGNPLCATNSVHMLPVSMVNTQGQIVKWRMCLFIVANTGADAIIGYPTLHQGGIVSYCPPEGYEQQLREELAELQDNYHDEAWQAVQNTHDYRYGPPDEVVSCFRTATRESAEETPQMSSDATMNGSHSTFTTTDYVFTRTRVPFGITMSPSYNNERVLAQIREMEESGAIERCEVPSAMPGLIPSTPPSEEMTWPQVPPVKRTNGPEQPEAGCKPPWNGKNDKRDHQPRKDATALLAATATEGNDAREKQNPQATPQEKRAKNTGSVCHEYTPLHDDGKNEKNKFTSYHCDGLMPQATPVFEKKEKQVEGGHKPNHAATLSSLTEKKKKKKGATDALTESSPYGQNPPLPEEVVEALNILKQLSETLPENLWSKEQLNEIQAKLSANRPEWAHCLTMTHTGAQFDEPTATFIENLMDSPRYQKSIFSKSLREPAKVAQFEIISKEGHDWWAPQKARRFKNPIMYAVVDKFLDWQIEDGLLKESNATRPAVITVVEKDGRDPRVCCDYRLRNERTEVPIYPMPDIQEHLDEAAGYEYYCSFDMAKMFNQIEIKQEHRDLAAFITHRGVFAPDRIQFGLAGGPQHAVREVGGLMIRSPLTNGVEFTKWAVQQNKEGKNPPYEITTSGIVKGSNLIPFIDDVFIKSNDKAAIVKLVELFFEFCEQYNLLLSRKKANVCKTYLKMLGMVVSKNGKHLDPSRIVSLLEAVRPRSKITMQSLLCSYNFVRMFVPNFSQIVAPLYDATKGIIWKGKGSDKSRGINVVDPEFEWSPEMIRAYDQLRAALLASPILACPNWSLPLYLSVDASLRGEGWVLWQLLPTDVPGQKVAVAILYGSRKYTETESAWEVTRQEATAIRDALIDVDEYVFGQEFYLFTDHLNLRWMHNSINRAVIRMRNFMSQYRMKIVHCPGIWNNADSHSRLESNPEQVKLAMDLNSASVANMQEGQNMTFSQGTCTDEDNLLDGVVKRTHAYVDTHETVTDRVAAVLHTEVATPDCKVAGCAFCTPAPELISDSDSSDSEWEEHTERNALKAHCLHTALAHEMQEVTHQDDTEHLTVRWSPAEVISQVLHQTDSTMPPDVLSNEAVAWNTHISKATPIYPSPMDQPTPDDQRDREDYEWCGKLRRSALVLRSAARTFKEKGNKGIPDGIACANELERELSEGLQKIQTRQYKKAESTVRIESDETQPEEKTKSLQPGKIVNLQSGKIVSPPGREVPASPKRTEPGSKAMASDTTECGEFVKALAQECATPEASSQQVREQPIEITEKTRCTQTSAADFRALNVKIPVNEDFEKIHGGTNGHHGVEYSYKKLLHTCGSQFANERGEATKVKEALKRYIEACPICQKVKAMRERIKSKHSFIVSRPFLEVSYDIVVFTHPDKHGNRYLIVAIDNFTKLVEVKAVPNKDAETIARFLLEVAGRYGHIARLRSDRDPAFTGHIIKYLNEVRSTETVMCIPYHPQANSICERQNALVMEHIKCMCVGNALGPNTRIGWSDLIPIVFSIINSTPKNPLGISPLAMVYGVFANYERPLLPARMPEGTVSNPSEYVDELMAHQNRLLKIAENIYNQKLNDFVRKYDKEVERANKGAGKPNGAAVERAFNEGDFVLINKKSLGGTTKLTPWVGPRLVLDRKDNNPSHPVLELLDLTDMTTSQASIDDCRVFNTGWFDEITMMQELVKLSASDKEEYVVESIYDHRPKLTGPKRTKPLSEHWFKVKWKDFEEAENTWEPWSALKDLEPFAQYAHDNPALNLTPAETAAKIKRK